MLIITDCNNSDLSYTDTKIKDWDVFNFKLIFFLINRILEDYNFSLYDRYVFQRHIMVFFMLKWFQLGWAVIVSFVDIGGMDDHHSLNLLFIITYQWSIVCEILVTNIGYVLFIPWFSKLNS